MRSYKDMETVEFMTPQGIAMFPWIFEKNPEPDDQGNTWYGVTIRFPKDGVDQDELKTMRRQFMKAAKEGWPEGNDPDSPGKFTEDFGSPLRDGDKFDKANNKKRREELFGCWYLSLKSKDRPGFVKVAVAGDKKVESGVLKAATPGEIIDILDKEDCYSGMIVVASGVTFPYENKGNEGVGVRLTNVFKVREGERFGGKPAAKEQFAKFGSGAPSKNDADDADDLL